MPAKKKVPQPEAIPTTVTDPTPATPRGVVSAAGEAAVLDGQYYGKLLREIPPRRNFGDRLYRIGRAYRVTSGARIDNEIEIEWPEDAS